MKKHKLGVTGWVDMCVEKPDEVSDFYTDVIGWNKEPFQEDPKSATHYFVKNDKGENQVGICDIKEFEPWAPGWVPYINVNNYDDIIKRTKESNGEVVTESIWGCTIPNQRVALIKDPSGAGVMICEIPDHLVEG